MSLGSITLAFRMCSLNVRFPVACVFKVIFKFLTLKMTLKTHSTEKRTSKLHIQNASVIDPLVCVCYFPNLQIIHSENDGTAGMISSWNFLSLITLLLK
jgi:hypothetical protein